MRKFFQACNVWLTPTRFFVVTATLFGGIMVFLTPPFQVPDENQHFLRAYTISEGKIVNRLGNTIMETGDMAPRSITQTFKASKLYQIRFKPTQTITFETIRDLVHIPLNRSDREFMTVLLTAYSPIVYLPQTTGILLGRIWHSPPIVLMYLGRICNLLFWIGLIYWAIKLLPTFKWVIALLALTPMSVFLAASLSADMITNGAAFFLFALVLHYAFTKETLMKRDFVLLFILASVIGLSKQGYSPLLLLYFLIPAKTIGTRRFYWFIGGLLLLTVALMNVLWSNIILQGYPFSLKSMGDATWIQGRPSEQMQLIVTHPVAYLQTIWHTIVNSQNDYRTMFIGKLGWLDTPLPGALVLSYQIVLIGVAILDHKSTIVITWQQKIGMSMFVILPILLLFFTAAAIFWNPPGSSIITGIQGRYFIPISPIIFLLLYNTRLKIPLNQMSVAIAAYSWIVLSITIITLIKRYYTGL